LVKNTDNNNGNVGIWGISYPGFMLLILLSRHPALKAVSPQACVSVIFSLMIFTIMVFIELLESHAAFGIQKTERTTSAWYQIPS
jgi:hypothetical protein